MPESSQYTLAKAALDGAIFDAIQKHGDMPTQPCDGTGEQPASSFGTTLTAIGSKLSEAQTLCNSLSPSCSVPPSGGSGQPNIFGRLQFAVTHESALGFSQASDVTWNRRTNQPVIIDQLNRIVYVNMLGVTQRSIQILNAPSPAPAYNNDFEGIQYLGSNGTTDEFAVLFEPGGVIFWLSVTANATSVSLDGAERYATGYTAEAIACDHATPNVLHMWTYGSTADHHVVITRGNPTSHVMDPLYTPNWVPGFRGAFWDKDFCPNPIKVGCSMSDVNLRELNHTNPNVPYGSIVSTFSFTRTNRKFEGGCFCGSEKKICLVAENGPENFFIFEAP